ncbi:MAG: hypothetical protein H6765_10615 [Candidatus Peribacteria bacterium]|nr:MAG: hypothetical protein H6765_10615 [Candidatus Peribacteria bacterium]
MCGDGIVDPGEECGEPGLSCGATGDNCVACACEAGYVEMDLPGQMKNVMMEIAIHWMVVPILVV